MLEAIRNRAQGILAWIIIGLIAIPFTLWGINSYFRDKGETIAASVNGEEITISEFRTAFQRYIQQMRFLMGQAFSEKMLDDPAIKQSVLNGLIEQRLVLDATAELGLRMSDSALSQVIRANKTFQDEKGQFDSRLYESVLDSEGLTPVGYEARLRLALLSEQLVSTLRLSAFVTQRELEDIARLRYQEREISYGIIPISKFHDAIHISDDKLHQYYDDHPDEFRIPEQVVINYLRLTGKSLAKDIPVDEQVLRNFYEEIKNQYTVPEQRRASHILIPISQQADEAAQQVAQEKAERVLERLQKGEAFEKVAKEVSKDAGSAKKGGDLGFFGRGVMDPAFEEEVFSLKEVGALSKPVLSKFGYHIIKLTGIQPGKVKSFEEVHKELAQKYRQQQAEDQFYEKADTLDNLTYENPSSLEIAAEALGLSVKTSKPFSQSGGSGIATNPKVVAAAFSEEVLQEGMNSQAIELGSNDLVVLRINRNIPAHVQPFEELHKKIREKLILAQAKIKAQELGEIFIKRLQQGESPEIIFPKEGITWNEKKFYTRNNTNSDIQPEILKIAYGLPRPQPEKPTFAGQPLKVGDYVVLGVYSVRDGDLGKLDEKTHQSLVQEIERSRGEIAYRDFIEEMKSEANIKVYAENL
jgi:peptidyl-prolyl cis-trans isomerase D